MPRASYGQRWGTRASSSSSDEDRPDYEDDLSELSELSDSDYTPDTDVEALVESDDDCLEDLEEHEFKLRENVLVKPRGSREWYKGVIVKIREPSLRDKRRGMIYVVVFRRYRTNIRDGFSVLEGNIKPDTPHVRALLLGT
ncbi:hypothetical protein C8Q74DRAFT_153075 [Fomes fomentarius]|nr:hypothetical protein C8Q74DRAFT_153075 [Fomes fomentarius]